MLLVVMGWGFEGRHRTIRAVNGVSKIVLRLVEVREWGYTVNVSLRLIRCVRRSVVRVGDPKRT